MKIDSNCTTKKSAYPYLAEGKSSHAVVLFIAPNTAIALSNPYIVGKYYDTVPEDAFEYFHGQVTLENE
jgi:hypothetical protein